MLAHPVLEQQQPLEHHFLAHQHLFHRCAGIGQTIQQREYVLALLPGIKGNLVGPLIGIVADEKAFFQIQCQSRGTQQQHNAECQRKQGGQIPPIAALGVFAGQHPFGAEQPPEQPGPGPVHLDLSAAPDGLDGAGPTGPAGGHKGGKQQYQSRKSHSCRQNSRFHRQKQNEGFIPKKLPYRFPGQQCAIENGECDSQSGTAHSQPQGNADHSNQQSLIEHKGIFLGPGGPHAGQQPQRAPPLGQTDGKGVDDEQRRTRRNDPQQQSCDSGAYPGKSAVPFAAAQFHHRAIEPAVDMVLPEKLVAQSAHLTGKLGVQPPGPAQNLHIVARLRGLQRLIRHKIDHRQRVFVLQLAGRAAQNAGHLHRGVLLFSAQVQRVPYPAALHRLGHQYLLGALGQLAFQQFCLHDIQIGRIHLADNYLLAIPVPQKGGAAGPERYIRKLIAGQDLLQCGRSSFSRAITSPVVIAAGGRVELVEGGESGVHAHQHRRHHGGRQHHPQQGDKKPAPAAQQLPPGESADHIHGRITSSFTMRPSSMAMMRSAWRAISRSWVMSSKVWPCCRW